VHGFVTSPHTAGGGGGGGDGTAGLPEQESSLTATQLQLSAPFPQHSPLFHSACPMKRSKHEYLQLCSL
jgi:hypothetical protein